MSKILETPYLGALETCCLIPFKRHDIGKVHAMVVVPSSNQNRMLVVRTLGNDAQDSLIMVIHFSNGGQDPVHIRWKVGGIPTQSVKIKLNKNLLTITK